MEQDAHLLLYGSRARGDYQGDMPLALASAFHKPNPIILLFFGEQKKLGETLIKFKFQPDILIITNKYCKLKDKEKVKPHIQSNFVSLQH